MMLSTYRDKSVEKLGMQLREKIMRTLRRSLYVLRVDTGSCNGCEIEIFATLSPVYDLERFGVRLVISPRHADALLVTGPVTRQYRPVLENIYKMTPEPKVVIAVGACACDGGIWYNSYAVEGGVDKVIPVDVYVPGCPPHPIAILQGVLVAVGVLEQKIKKVSYEEESATRDWKLVKPLALVMYKDKPIKIPWELYRSIRLIARKYLGYLYSEKLVLDYVEAISGMRSIDELDDIVEKLSVAWKSQQARRALEEMAKVTRKYIVPAI